MTQDDITRLWQESSDDSEGMSLGYPTQQHYFAALIAAAEREECAKVAENGLIGHTIAQAIRARGQQ